MNYEFPTIVHLDRVLPHLDDNFSVKEQNGITYINYKVSSLDVFPPISDLSSKIRRECRGIAFKDGVVVSRPFHKFFNLNEREETANINLFKPHDVLEKLDGSMIRPVPTPDGFRLATKAGITDVSMQAEVFVSSRPEYEFFFQQMASHNLTPIFEFTSPDNRIVLGYEEEALTLLAIRDNHTGEYANYDGLLDLTSDFGIPVVKKVTLEYLQEEDDKEGVVLVFGDGMVKAKTEWYVKRHKAKELIENERHLLRLILDDELDDILPLVDTESRQKLLSYQANVLGQLKTEWKLLERSFEACKVQFKTKKELAAFCKLVRKPISGWLFKLWDKPGLTSEEVVLQSLQNHLGSNKKFKQYQEVFPYLKMEK